MSKALTVYKASAGSGKTFTLAVEYIKLLVRNPQSYRTILAVTFTNKATEEMKMRILSQLYGIWKRLPDSRTYTERVCRDLDMGEQAVSQRAGTALRLLIHNYGYFRIETIDAFFQTVLRNLARELDLTANLRIELNDGQVEEAAVDRLIEELDRNNGTLHLIMEYINDKIADDKGWNVIGQIKAFGKTIFRDFYKEHSRTMAALTAQPKFMDGYAARMRREADDAKGVMAGIAKEFFDALGAEGLSVDDLAYREKGIHSFFDKLSKGIFDESIVTSRVNDCLNSEEKWCTKTSPRRDLIRSLAAGTFIPLLASALDERPKQWRRFKSAELTLRHLYQLRLLESIERKVREMNEDANRFLLSDTQQLLHSLIQGSDSPFIFEKIGTRLEHVMIDEFQDTSMVQWRNFKVLLEECMSHEEAANLIVGDVKQSIYRWRSGDWRLLNDIEGQFGDPDRRLSVRSLTTNYRSLRNVVTFNNAFFTRAARMESALLVTDGCDNAGQLQHAYGDVAQELPEKKRADGNDDGYVSVRLLPKDDYTERVLDETVEAVGRLLEAGVPQSGIAILVRTNNYIPLIAKHFAATMPEVRIVSDEAFRLDASPAVLTLVQALRLLTHPDDTLTRANLAKTCALTGVCAGRNETDEPLLPEDYTANAESLAAMPLYNLAERLYNIFHLERIPGQSAYVCAFYDNLNKFTQDGISDIDSFLAEWERAICNKTIQSDESDGIRLISIHKSKGLEFDNVIIPFCDWQMEKTMGNILWCEPKEAPFDGLAIVPIDYGRKGMMGTIFEDDYKDEHLQNCVDNLNLLYVAFTRAAQRLFVIGRRDSSNSRSQIIENCLPDLPEMIEGATIEEDEVMSFELGEMGRLGELGALRGLGSSEKPSDEKSQSSQFTQLTQLSQNSQLSQSSQSSHNSQLSQSSQSPSLNVFSRPSTPIGFSIESFANRTEFVQSNRSRDFIEGTDEDDSTNEYIRTGSLLHRVFSQIATADDIDGALRELETEGIIPPKAVAQTADMLRKRLAWQPAADWFSGRWTLYNECSILSVDDQGDVIERRPDRVMTDGRRMVVVDFKFGRPRDEYRRQVREYITLLQGMGHADVEGYIWYVYTNKTEEVE